MHTPLSHPSPTNALSLKGAFNKLTQAFCPHQTALCFTWSLDLEEHGPQDTHEINRNYAGIGFHAQTVVKYLRARAHGYPLKKPLPFLTFMEE